LPPGENSAVVHLAQWGPEAGESRRLSGWKTSRFHQFQRQGPASPILLKCPVPVSVSFKALLAWTVPGQPVFGQCIPHVFFSQDKLDAILAPLNRHLESIILKKREADMAETNLITDIIFFAAREYFGSGVAKG
jgi:hypothetical protein